MTTTGDVCSSAVRVCRLTGGTELNGRELRRVCDNVVRGFQLPVPFTIDALVAQVAAKRGRPIQLMAMPEQDHRPNHPCGLWIEADEIDYIMYPPETTQHHHNLIVLHELGHMELGHKSSVSDKEEIARLLMPNLSPALIRRVLARTVYTNEEERAAELVASLTTLAVSRAAGAEPEPDAGAPGGTSTLVQHLGAALERNTDREP